MKFEVINICPKKDSGLCNQLYSLMTGICNCIDKNINILFIGKFYKEINSSSYCNISEILDLNYLNNYLSEYNIFLVDINNFSFNIEYSYIIDENNKILSDITSQLKEYNTDNEFVISQNFLYLNFTKNENNKNENNKLIIRFKLNNRYFDDNYSIIDNSISNFINYNFKSINYNIFSVIGNKHAYFWKIMANIKFTNIFTEKANEIKSLIIKSSYKINCIHLRLENDFIKHYSSIFNTSESIILDIFENIYLQEIKKNIIKNEFTIVLTGNNNNNVIKFLDDNYYNYIVTPKLFNERELNAIVDLEIGQLCNNLYLYLFESSFSYTLLYKILKKNIVKLVEINIEDVIKKELYL